MATTANKNIPALRFPGFKGEWEEKILRDAVINSTTKVDPRTSKVEFKCIELEHLESNTGRILATTNSKGLSSAKNIFKSNDVLFGKLRPYLRKFAQPNFDGVCSSEIWVLKGKEVNNSFLFQFVQTNPFLNLANLSTGSKMPRADWNVVSTGTIYYPLVPEQQKIASFLSSVDECRQQLQQQQSVLEQYKKGCMQQLFSQKLRFKNDKGKAYPDWKEMKLGNIFENRVEKGANEESELLSVTINNGVKRHRDLDRINNSSDDKSSYLSVKIGDIVYNSMRMWQGACGVSYWNGIVSPAYTVLKINEEFNNIYFAFLFKLDETIKIFQKHSQGLTSDTWNLKYSKFKNISVIVPSLEEQTKIANFLSAIDEQINMVKQQIAQTQQFKKGLLQQMFV